MKKYCYQSTIRSTCVFTAAILIGLAHPSSGAKQSAEDKKVADAVKSALKDFPLTASMEPRVKVENGVVTLTGNSENLPLKNLASETASTVVGVRAIVNDLEIREIDRDDEQIQQDIDRVFTLNYRNRDKAINYRTSDGVVTLNGTVSSPAVSRLAENMASSVVGVRSVVNLLRVIPVADRTDEEIRQVVALKLNQNPWVDQDLVKVEVSDSVVSFHGAVDSMSERSRLIQLADTWGVTVNAENLKVSNELRSPMERPHRPVFLSDLDLQETLTEAFRQHPRLEENNIEIDVVDGDITLAGSVDSIGDKSAAERIAADLPGAEFIYSFIYVETVDDLTNESLENSIDQLFRSDALLAGSDIQATAKQGVVTLEGTAHSIYIRRRAMQMARNTKGVKQVKSKLRIKWETPEAYTDVK